MHRLVLIVSLGLALAAAGGWVVADVAAQTPVRLIATVGPGSELTLTNAAGRRVTTLRPGQYRITVRDRSARDNFHLTGPGVNRKTGLAFRGTQTWLVTLRAGGVYTYVSDARPRALRGVANVSGLVATVGPGFTITLTAAGRQVETMKPGPYRLQVHDRSPIHNFRLVGPGVSRQTGVAATGTVVWQVRLVRGQYRFLCVPHPDDMLGGFRVEP